MSKERIGTNPRLDGLEVDLTIDLVAAHVVSYRHLRANDTKD